MELATWTGMHAISTRLLLVGMLSVGACIVPDVEGELEENYDEPIDVMLLQANEDEVPVPVDGVDAISAASQPPELFVEIISPQDGDTVKPGSSIAAFGGPGWAVPSMELLVDGAVEGSQTGFNVQFEAGSTLTPGTHSFKVEFTCVLESCAGQSASATLSLNIAGSEDGPDDSTNPDDSDQTTLPEDGDDTGSSDGETQPEGTAPPYFSAGACSAAGHEQPRSGFALLVVLLLGLRIRHGFAKSLRDRP